ncbi:MAG: YggT family protein [Rhodobacteraceae bacterium]|nr:MAG: YggT family protein [Paracoccaceae bacterium]
MLSLFQILNMLLDIVWFFVIAHIIMSWLINFQVLNVQQPLVGQMWRGLNMLLAPMYNRIRRILPQMGGLDLAPLVVLVGIMILRVIIRNNALALM